ncbi:PIG-L deacetylase family protein [Micromonospora sp. CA-263727]|uniref:PIG-L deacetylase family protein n=1 Tax=Micromonospora sp. CA-263727 TaxID=3239967 RepID=UPI003D8BA952
MASHPDRILVVAAHADDETLGAGGTLATHAAHGAQLCILILSTSVSSRPDADQTATASHRARCARDVAALYGADLRTADLPDNRFDTLALLDITRHIEAAIADVAPTTVYTHSHADLSRDHQLVAHATAAATRPHPGTPVRTVLAYEVRSATEWSPHTTYQPTWYQPLTTTAVDTKMAALTIYNTEMRPSPHSRSLAAVQAQLAERGARVGTEAAEAFEVIRHIR